MGRTPKTRQIQKKSGEKQPQCKMIHWNEKADKLTNQQLEEMFVRKELAPAQPPDKQTSSGLPPSTGGSLLSQLMSHAAAADNNPFLEYAKFAGEGVDTQYTSTKDLDIFLAFLPDEDDRMEPWSVIVLDTATVQEVIGLALYKYSQEEQKAKLQADIKAYALYIAEEDGAVDLDFPALDEKDVISKFGFQQLAIVEKHPKAKRNKSSPPPKKDVVVKVHINKNGFSTVKVDRTDVKMKTIFSKLVKKRQLRRSGKDYHLETDTNPGVMIDLEATLESFGTLNFNLIKEGEIKVDLDEPDGNRSTIPAMLTSFNYKAYHVSIVHRVMAKTDVQLGIDGKKIEIDPVAPAKNSKFWPKMKPEPVALLMENIAHSELVEDKTRALFRIYYKKTDVEFKHYEFEALSPLIAEEIVSKINNILDSHLRPVRTEYLSLKKEKHGVKKR
jgi:hypothetical protein